MLFQVPFYLMELLFAVYTNMSSLRAQVALNIYDIIVLIFSYFCVHFIVNFGSLRVVLGNVNEVIFLQRQNLSEPSRSCSCLSIKLTKEADFSKIFIHMELFDVGMRALLHYHYSSFCNELHLCSFFFFFKNVIIH